MFRKLRAKIKINYKGKDLKISTLEAWTKIKSLLQRLFRI